MIFTEEQALLKGRQQFDEIIALVTQAADGHQRIDTLERSLMTQLLALGHSLLDVFLIRQGEVDRGETLSTNQGPILKRLPQRHQRRYLSIFGQHTITRFVYGSREGQKIEHVPLDELLGLPQGDFSYLLQDWSQRLCLKESFAEAASSLRMLLGLSLGIRALEQINHTVAESAPAFRDQVEPPPAAEKGPILVVTADGKGVSMRRPEAKAEPQPHHRRTKGEKANKKQMACVGAVYSIAPFVREPSSIVDEVVRHQQAERRPRPRHKRVWAEMSRQVEGFPVTAKEGLFYRLWSELAHRNPGDERPVVCLMDGERALWEAKRVYFPEAVGVRTYSM